MCRMKTSKRDFIGFAYLLSEDVRLISRRHHEGVAQRAMHGYLLLVIAVVEHAWEKNERSKEKRTFERNRLDI